MSTTTTTQIVQEAPDIQEYKLGLYNTGQDFIMRMQGIDPATGQPILDPETGQPIGPQLPPVRSVAGLTQEQTAAADLLRGDMAAGQGIGG